MNCWEIMDCGRHPGGKNEEKDGACPAATSRDLDGINKGTCGGRACW
ncbi:MAG: two-CW domain-containing protein, partial [Thermoplasmatota archaeon]